MRRALLLLALTGCASAGTSSSEATPHQAAIFTSPETGTLLQERPVGISTRIAAPPVAVWVAVKKVYADFEIPLTVDNVASHQLGNPNFYKTRQINGQSMTQFVDCGSGMTGAKAASYRIFISLLTDVETDGAGGTNVRTTFVAMGQDLGGNSSDRIPCGSTGNFEKYFLDHVKRALGK